MFEVIENHRKIWFIFAQKNGHKNAQSVQTNCYLSVKITNGNKVSSDLR